MNNTKVATSNLRKVIPLLHAGDKILLSGRVYTARDAAHKKIVELIENGEPIPFSMIDACIYFAGPTPTPNGLPIGSCGPTTSERMDAYSPTLLDKGLACMIGKGPRNKAVMDSIVKNGAIYLCATGGAGALAAKCITSAKEIAFPELGCESIKELEFNDFPLIVGIDSFGNSIFK